MLVALLLLLSGRNLKNKKHDEQKKLEDKSMKRTRIKNRKFFARMKDLLLTLSVPQIYIQMLIRKSFHVHQNEYNDNIFGDTINDFVIHINETVSAFVRS